MPPKIQRRHVSRFEKYLRELCPDNVTKKLDKLAFTWDSKKNGGKSGGRRKKRERKRRREREREGRGMDGFEKFARGNFISSRIDVPVVWFARTGRVAAVFPIKIQGKPFSHGCAFLIHRDGGICGNVEAGT